MAETGFEPTPPKRLVPKTRALDHSATLPCHFPMNYLYYRTELPLHNASSLINTTLISNAYL